MPATTQTADTISEMLAEITADLARWQSLNDLGWANTPPRASHPAESDVWTTSEVLLWLINYDSALNTRQHHKQILDGLTYLVKHQNLRDPDADDDDLPIADGGWGLHRNTHSDATATALAVSAFAAYARHNPSEYTKYLPNMLGGRDWLMDNIHEDGGFRLRNMQQHSTAFNTYWGLKALRECAEITGLQMPTIKASILPAGLKFVMESMKNGGWGNILSEKPDSLGTAYSAHLLLSLPEARSDRTAEARAERGLDWLRNHQEHDGSWQPGPAQPPVEATAWAVMALLTAGENIEAPRIESAVRYLEDLYKPHIGWSPMPGGDPEVWVTVNVCLALSSYADAARGIQRPIEHSRQGTKVFIVHGRDRDLRRTASELVKNAGLVPIILQDLPNQGRVLTEKFEFYANQEGVDYALVLCTSDDIGALAAEAGTPQPRARQNVIYELGYFIGRLGRERICIVSDDPELPSDLRGIAVIMVDDPDYDWTDRVVAEFRAARLPIKS